MWLECRDLTRKELDLVLLGLMMAGICDGLENTSEKYGHGVAERKRSFTTEGIKSGGIHGIGMVKILLISELVSLGI